MATYELKKLRSANELPDLYGLVAHLPEADLPARFPVAFSCREFEARFMDLLRFDIHDIFRLVTPQGEIVGCVYSYDYRIYDGHCKVAFYFSPEVDIQDAQNAVNEFSDYMFCEYPLMKLFFETSSLDIKSLALCQAAGFTCECTLKEYLYQKNKYVNLCIFGKERFNA